MKKLLITLCVVVLSVCVHAQSKIIEVPTATAGVMILGGGVPPTVASDACATCPDAAGGADMVCEDFEEGDGYLCTAWTLQNTNGPDVTVVSHSGTLNCTDKGTKCVQTYQEDVHEEWLSYDYGSDFAKAYFKFYINIVDSLYDNNDEEEIFGFGSNTSGNDVGRISLQYTTINGLRLYFRYHAAGAFTGALSSTLSPNTWYKVAIEYDQSGADGTDVFRCWLNDSLVVDGTSLTLDRTSRYILVNEGGAIADGDETTIQWDNFKIDDDAMPGDCPL